MDRRGGSGTVFVNNRYADMPQLQAQWDMFTTLVTNSCI